MKSVTHPTIGSGNFDHRWKARLSNQHVANKARQKANQRINNNHLIEVKRDAQGVIDYDYYAHEAVELRADAFREYCSMISKWFIQAGKEYKG